jgi:NAD(P)-dependent dehydrogenase (short-subunit alcohol dehydrogenase family)
VSSGRVAVITGGASGVGLAAATRFAAMGMRLVLADLSQDALDKAAAQLSAFAVPRRYLRRMVHSHHVLIPLKCGNRFV